MGIHTESFHFGTGRSNSDYDPNYSGFHVKMSPRIHRLKARIEELRIENATFRKPCKTCGNLVKPELQGQHDDAYHHARN